MAAAPTGGLAAKAARWRRRLPWLQGVARPSHVHACAACYREADWPSTRGGCRESLGARGAGVAERRRGGQEAPQVGAERAGVGSARRAIPDFMTCFQEQCGSNALPECTSNDASHQLESCVGRAARPACLATRALPGAHTEARNQPQACENTTRVPSACKLRQCACYTHPALQELLTNAWSRAAAVGPPSPASHPPALATSAPRPPAAAHGQGRRNWWQCATGQWPPSCRRSTPAACPQGVC